MISPFSVAVRKGCVRRSFTGGRIFYVTHHQRSFLWKQALVDEVEELRVDSTEVAESLWLLFL